MGGFGMSTTYPDIDATEGHSEPFYYPGEATATLLEAIEEDKAMQGMRLWQLEGYTDSELLDELERRNHERQ